MVEVYCKQCGVLHTENDRFCGKCGSSMIITDKLPESAQTTDLNKFLKSKSKERIGFFSKKKESNKRKTMMLTRMMMRMKYGEKN